MNSDIMKSGVERAPQKIFALCRRIYRGRNPETIDWSNFRT